MFLLFLLLFSKWLYFLLRCSTSIFISCIKGNTKAGLAQIKPLGTNRSKKVKVWGQIWFALNPTLRAVGEPRQKHQSLLFTSQPFPPNLAESSDYWMPVNLISLMSLKAPVTEHWHWEFSLPVSSAAPVWSTNVSSLFSKCWKWNAKRTLSLQCWSNHQALSPLEFSYIFWSITKIHFAIISYFISCSASFIMKRRPHTSSVPRCHVYFLLFGWLSDKLRRGWGNAIQTIKLLWRS